MVYAVVVQTFPRFRIAAFVLALGLLANGCSALDEFDEVLVDEIRIPTTQSRGTPFSAKYDGNFGSLDLSKAREFQNNGVDPSDVDAIFVKSIDLEMIVGRPELEKLDALLASLEFFVEADGVERATIARVTDFPATAAMSVPLLDPDANLAPFATAPSMRIGANLELVELGPNAVRFNTTLRTTLTLHIDIDLLGV